MVASLPVQFDYLNTFQVGLCCSFIIALGFLCGKINMFKADVASTLRRAMYMICMPGLVFRQIATNDLNLRTWSPFINGILVQVTFHVIYAVFVALMPIQKNKKDQSNDPITRDSKIGRFMNLIYSTCCTSYISYGFPLAQFVFGIEYSFVPTMQQLVHHIFLVPFHTYFNFQLDKLERNDDHDQNDSVQNIEDINNNAIEECIPKNSSSEESLVEIESGTNGGNGDPIIPIEDPENPENIKNTQNQETAIKSDDNILISSGEIISSESEPKEEKNSSKSDEEEFYIDDSLEDHVQSYIEELSEASDSKDSTVSPAKLLLWQIVTPVNVLTLLGIIWSAIGWKFPVFVEETTKDLQITIVGLSLFTTGVFMHDHPFFGCYVPELIMNLILHFIVVPLVSMFWCWICKVDSTIAKICVIVQAMPCEIIGYVLSINSGYGMKSASYSFFWSNILGLPILMLWVIFFDELEIFH